MIRAALFDMDGLLADTEPFWRQAQVEVFAAHGLHLQTRDCVQTMGMRVHEVVAYWESQKGFSHGSTHEISEKIVQRVIQKVEQSAQVLPGVKEVVFSAKERGLLLAVVSSSHKILIDSLLQKIQLKDVFDLVVSAQHLIFGKPHPLPYLEAARMLCVQNKECVAFEDSPNGVKSALAAGMRVVAVPDKEQKNNSIFASANLTFSSLEKWTDDCWNILQGKI